MHEFNVISSIGCTDAGATQGVRTAIVVTSVHHGNTRSIAGVMAHAMEADVLSAEDAAVSGLGKYDIVGLGSGIYFGRHHSSLLQLAKSVDRIPKLAFVFSTSGLPWLSRLFHWPLRRALTRRGCRVVGEFNCRGWDSVGPLCLVGGINRRHPNDRDVDRAKQFALDMRDQV